jgi:aerotaxis receptor
LCWRPHCRCRWAFWACNWQQRGLKRLLRLAEQTTSDPLIAQMYTDSRGAQARLEMSILSQEARLKTCLTRLQDTAEHLTAQAQAVRHPGAGNSSTGLERQRVETEQVATAVNQMAATTQEVASHVQRTADATQQANRADRPRPRHCQRHSRSHPAFVVPR